MHQDPFSLWITDVADVHSEASRRDDAEDVRLLCWHCCHSFDTKPLQYPFAYLQKKDEFRVGGHFCSWECLSAYDGKERKTRLSVPLAYYRKRVTGEYKHTTSAPPRCTLKAFGGHLSIDEFRRSSGSEYYVTMHNIVQIVPYVQAPGEPLRKTRDTAPRHKPGRVDFSSETTKTETLRLSRPTPLSHTARKNTIERVFGLNSLIKKKS